LRTLRVAERDRIAIDHVVDAVDGRSGGYVRCGERERDHRRHARHKGYDPDSQRRRASSPADPPVLHTAVPTWQAGDTIPLGANRTLRVLEARFVNEDPVLVVERA
jgi:hypothetical protein